MERVLEPELMEDEEQAEAYARADFEEPNAAFVAHLTGRFGTLPATAEVVDLGCGPADIPIRLARAFPGWRIDAVDGSAAMLRLAREAAEHAGVLDRVRLVRDCVPSERLPEAGYDVVLSNSLLHHLAEPAGFWATIRRLARRPALVMVVDLARPADPDAARSIVETYSGSEPEVLRRDFLNSLLAAFTPEEVRAELAAAGLGALDVERISDRHWLAGGWL